MEPFEPLPLEHLPEKPRLPHAYFDAGARAVRVDSERFGAHEAHVRELGAGPPLLLVHGLMTTGYSWRYVIAPLARRFRVIAPDLVGCGRSDKPAGAYTVEALASWLGDLVRALGVRGCAVVGNSLGGHVCRRLALDDPGAMRALVDIHSPVLPEARYAALHAALAVPGARALLGALIRRDPRRWAHRHVHYFDETRKSLEEAREYGEPLATDEGARAFARWLSDAMAPAGFRAMARDLGALAAAKRPFPVPLTLVYARRDPMVRPENGAQMARWFPDAELVWLERSSHFPQVDTPDELVAIVERRCA